MDALTFGTPILLRHLTDAKKIPVAEYNLQKVLDGLKIDMEEFIDLCILLGCDYCPKMPGVGPRTGLKLIQEHKSIEKIIKNVDDKKKSTIPNEWMFKEARELFQKPEVTSGNEIELKWEKPDEKGILKFLCEDNGFSVDRVRNGIQKLIKAKQTKTQMTIDSFFKVKKDVPCKRKGQELNVGKQKMSKK